MAAVTLRNVSAPGLGDGFDLAIQDREFVVLAGPEGSGNAAAIRLIAGLADLSGGEILFDGVAINDVAPKDRDVALVAGDYTPYPRLTVNENLAVGLERRKFAETEIKKRVAAVAETLGLTPRLQANADSLSADQVRLVGLARAMVRQPKVYLFDAPFSCLDPAAARRGRAEVIRLRQRSSATFIYATHDAAEAIALDQRTVVVDHGVIQQDAVASVIVAEPANISVAKFFGELPMNLVEGSLKQERDGVTFSESGDGTITVRWPAAALMDAKHLIGGPVVLGFRPEHSEIAAADSSGPRFRGLVERAEPRDAETDLYVQTGAHDLICRSRRWVEPGKGGHRFEFEIQPGKMHLFDPENGRLVTSVS